MRVINRKEDKNRVPLSKLKTGDTFYFEGRLFMKTGITTDTYLLRAKNELPENTTLAVSVNSGYLMIITNNTTVDIEPDAYVLVDNTLIWD